jgi:hypothetical protein
MMDYGRASRDYDDDGGDRCGWMNNGMMDVMRKPWRRCG